MAQPFFSVVVIWHESQGMRVLTKAICSIDYPDTEVVLVHDGPIDVLPPVIGAFAKTKRYQTEKRYNDYGHSLKGWVIPKLEGKYVLWLNADNELFPNALANAKKLIIQAKYPRVCFFPVLMEGLKGINNDVWYGEKRDKTCTGLCVGELKYGKIDLLCGIIDRDVYDEFGWPILGEQSDFHNFVMYATKYGFTWMNQILGVHR